VDPFLVGTLAQEGMSQDVWRPRKVLISGEMGVGLPGHACEHGKRLAPIVPSVRLRIVGLQVQGAPVRVGAGWRLGGHARQPQRLAELLLDGGGDV
jgi:hypothetical protein